MSQRLHIVYTAMLLAIVSTVSGCTSATSPTVVPHSGTDGIRESPDNLGRWTTKAPMPTTRYLLGAGVANGILYAIGGADNYYLGAVRTVEAYDPTSDTWTTKAPMPTMRWGLSVASVNGILYAIGGADRSGLPRYGSLTTVEAYDPVADTWTSKAPMPTPRLGLTTGVVDGIIYAVGGCCNRHNFSLTAVEAYDPATNSWATKAPIPYQDDGSAAAVVNGVLYVVGGEFPNDPIQTVEAYDPATDTWTAKASLPVARQSMAAGDINGILYAVGGSNAYDAKKTVFAYNPATDRWTTKAQMPTARENLAAGVVNGVLYALGGSDRLGNFYNTNEAFTP